MDDQAALKHLAEAGQLYERYLEIGRIADLSAEAESTDVDTSDVAPTTTGRPMEIPSGNDTYKAPPVGLYLTRP